MKKIVLSALFLFFVAPGVIAQVTEKKATKIATSKQLDPEKIKGNYAAANMPGILIFNDGEKLMAKIPQQPSMALTYAGNNMYRSEKPGTVLEFKPEQKQLILTYNNAQYTYTKE